MNPAEDTAEPHGRRGPDTSVKTGRAPDVPLTPDQLAAIRRFDTCTVANALEAFDRRLRNEGSMDGRVRCWFPNLPRLLGYAVPIRIRTASPPAQGHVYVDRTDWWSYILSLPAPRVIVAQDMDDPPGVGAMIGEVHANILQALGCVGLVTNGAVRDLPETETLGFHFFAGGVAVSHAYAHLVELGCRVEVGGLAVRPGDLLLGDRHGVLSIPPDVAPAVPAEAARQVEREREVIALCRSGTFTLAQLKAAVEGAGHDPV